LISNSYKIKFTGIFL